MAQQAAPPGTPPTRAPEHQHLDSRFGHNRYYYDRGYAVHTPPDGGLSNLHVYAAMRGQTMEDFMKTRNAPNAVYSVSGSD